MYKSRAAAFFSGVVVFVLLSSGEAAAQSGTQAGAARQQPDQVIAELLSEVHQLRVAMQRMTVNTYRSQIMVERLRIQQDQVSRLTGQLNSLKNEMAEIKDQQGIFKERLDLAESQQDSGIVSEAQVSEIRTAMKVLTRRGQSLAERETQVAAELEQERANLADLNRRIDALEREIVTTGLIDDRKSNQKR